MRPTRIATAAAVLALIPATAFAHTGIGDAHGFSHGFMHPVGGLDHVLAMVAVGLFAACLGGRALWAVPSAFVGMMAVGGALGVAQIGLPLVELGIAGSVIVLGLAVAFRWTPPVLAAAALAGFFAIFHGYAHGAEMPLDASGLSYGLGFMLVTALLHCAGIAAGLGAGRLGSASRYGLQAGGGVMALAGVGILSGLI